MRGMLAATRFSGAPSAKTHTRRGVLGTSSGQACQQKSKDQNETRG